MSVFMRTSHVALFVSIIFISIIYSTKALAVNVNFMQNVTGSGTQIITLVDGQFSGCSFRGPCGSTISVQPDSTFPGSYDVTFNIPSGGSGSYTFYFTGDSRQYSINFGALQTAMPEPSTWIEMITGFLFAGFALRRSQVRRQNRGVEIQRSPPGNHYIRRTGALIS